MAEQRPVYRWMCCQCGGDNNIILDQGCSSCFNHWKCSSCQFYEFASRSSIHFEPLSIQSHPVTDHISSSSRGLSEDGPATTQQSPPYTTEYYADENAALRSPSLIAAIVRSTPSPSPPTPVTPGYRVRPTPSHFHLNKSSDPVALRRRSDSRTEVYSNLSISGFDAHKEDEAFDDLTKPIDEGLLLGVIRACLGGEGVPRA